MRSPAPWPAADTRFGGTSTYEGSDEPVLLLAERLYRGRFPKAKVLVPVPMAVFTGRLAVDGEPVEVAGWTGSQNHNWGSQHTDEYAWGQVAGFDDAPGSFLECSTARVRVAGLRTPWLSPMVLRHDGREYSLTGVAAARRAAGRLPGQRARVHLDATVRRCRRARTAR